MLLIRSSFLLAGLVLFCSLNTLAQSTDREETLTGMELLSACSMKEGVDAVVNTQFCYTYILGLVQTVTALQEMSVGEPLFCINPEQTSIEKVRTVIVTWLQNHGERLDEDAYVLTSEALSTAYPCGLV